MLMRGSGENLLLPVSCGVVGTANYCSVSIAVVKRMMKE
jgi:hypothetical protein